MALSKKEEAILNLYSFITKQPSSEIIKNYSNADSQKKQEILTQYQNELIKIRYNKTNGKTVRNFEDDAVRWYRDVLSRARDAGVTRLDIGRFYHFTYRSDYYPDLLAFYDTKPLIFLFDKKVANGKTYLYGLNFHWLARDKRIAIVSKMIQYFGSAFLNNEILPLKYTDIKSWVGNDAYYAIRRYIRDNIKQKVVALSNLEITHAINLPSSKFVGITEEQAILLVKRYRNMRQEINAKRNAIKNKSRKEQQAYHEWLSKMKQGAFKGVSMH